MDSPKVFLSYVKENEKIIKSIDKSLTNYGINVITDYKNLEGGSNWKRTLQELIDGSGYYIPCFSKEVNQRVKTVFYRELDYAIEIAKDIPIGRIWIIPVRINDCTIPKIEVRSREMLSDFHWIDLFPDTKFENGIKSIIDTIKSKQSKTTPNNKTHKHHRERKYYKERKELDQILYSRLDISPIDYIRSLPKIKLDLLQKIEMIKTSKTPPGGTTIDICEINGLYIDALNKILIKLASFYSQDYFNYKSPQMFFSEILSARNPLYKIITEPEGPGTGGTIRTIHHTHLVMEDIENLIKIMVDGLLYPKGDYPGLDYDNWLKQWRGSD